MIKIDLNKINNDSYDIYIVLSHEIRHIFQWDVVNDTTGEFETEVDDKTALQWEKDYEDYRDSRFSDYLNQSVEIDAVAFSYVICRTLFGINVEAKCDKVLLSGVVYSLINNYSEDEILSIAKDYGIKPRRILA